MVADNFTHLGSFFSRDANTVLKLSARVSNVRAADAFCCVVTRYEVCLIKMLIACGVWSSMVVWYHCHRIEGSKGQCQCEKFCSVYWF